MSRRGIWVLAAVALVAAAGCAPKADTAKDAAAIRAMNDAWGQAVTQGDAAAMAGQFADDAVRLFPHMPILSGKAAIAGNCAASVDHYLMEETDITDDVQVVGDLAYARGTYTWKATPKAPGPAVVDDRGKFVTIYRRQADGAWKIVLDAPSSDLPAIRILEPSSEDELALLQIERDWSAAWLKQDAAALDAILADSYVENQAGTVRTKKQILADVKAGLNAVASIDVSDIRVVVFGDHAAVDGMTVSSEKKKGQDTSAKLRWTDTFVKEDGRWRAVFTHHVELK